MTSIKTLSTALLPAITLIFGAGLGLTACGDAVAPTAPSSHTVHQSALISVPDDQPTIQAAIDAAAAGEVIQISAGSYQEDLTLKADVILQGAGVGQTVIFGTIAGATNVTINDLSVSGSLTSGGTGIVVEATSSLNRVAIDGFDVGVDVSASGATLDALDVTGTSLSGIAISGSNTSTIITNSTLRLNSRDGVTVVGSQNDLVMLNNLMFANGHASTDGAGVWAGDGHDVEITNSILTSNNTGLYCDACVNDFNIIWGNNLNYSSFATGGPNNINLDPRFNSPGENDFTLRFDSPAIDAGADAGPSTDAVGTARPLGGGFDIGPYELLAENPTITIAITEIMANPVDEATGEYVELFNHGTSAVDVSGYRITDGDAWDTVVGFQGGSASIPAGGYAVIVDPGATPASFVAAGAVLLTVETTASIGSGLSTSDPIKLYLADGVSPVDTFSFPFNPGNGVSIEKDSIEDGDSPDNWVTSPCGSSPGASNCASLPPNVSTSVLIAINEVMSNPLDESTGEYIELYNFGTDPIELAGLIIDDGDSSDILAAYMGSGTLLQPGQFAVILDPQYDGVTYTIPSSALTLTVASTATIGTGLATNDPISLIDGVGQVIDTYTHNFNAGNGVAVEKVDPTIGDISANFSASSCPSGGSPGAVNCVTLDGTNPIGEQTLAISEVMANALNEDTGEFVELYNYGNEAIDLVGYRIDDGDKEEKLVAFQGGSTMIPSGGFAVIVDSEYDGEYAIPGAAVIVTTGDTTIGTGLSTNDPIRLRAPKGATPIDTYFFPFNPGNGISAEKIDLVIGDVPQNWIASPCNASPGALNCADGGLGGGEAPVSATDLVISEVMANPLNEDTGEYVELFNAGPVGIDVAGWRLSDGDSFDTIQAWSTGGTVIAPGQLAVILDPEYANDYTIGAGTIRLTVGDTTLGNGITTTDPITLYEADGVTVVDSFSFAYNPGNGRSVEKVTLTSGDVAENWVTSTCRVSNGDTTDFASPGRRNCVDPYGGISGTNTLGQSCPFGAADCLTGLCAVDLLTGDSFCTESCTTGPDSCPNGLQCTSITDSNYPDVCIPVGGGAVPDVKISEVLYNAVGGDTEVFIELDGTDGTIVDGLKLVGINGSTGKVYTTLSLTGQISASGFFVVAHPSATGAIAAAADMVSTKVDFQNGPDSIQLRYGSEIIDAIGYGDFSGAVFGGEGTPVADVQPGESLSRSGDTDDNAADFTATAVPTPGAAN